MGDSRTRWPSGVMWIAFVLEAMRAALATAMPRVCNGDQGSHFTSPQHLAVYNQRRLHQALNYQTPAAIYSQSRKEQPTLN
jgi:hypothetical protein